MIRLRKDRHRYALAVPLEDDIEHRGSRAVGADAQVEGQHLVVAELLVAEVTRCNEGMKYRIIILVVFISTIRD